MSKLIYSFILLPLFLFSQNSNEKITISERIGANIELSEREYFNLFPEIKGFSNAYLTRDLGTNSIMILVNYSDFGFHSDSIHINKKILLALKSSIEQFEKSQWQDTLKNIILNSDLPNRDILLENLFNWDSLEDRLILLNEPYIDGEAGVYYNRGEYYQGFVLGGNNTDILMIESFQDYYWEEPLKKIKQIPISGIDQIMLYENTKIGVAPGAVGGLVIGGVVGAAIGSRFEGEDPDAMFAGLATVLGVVFGGTIGALAGGSITADMESSILDSTKCHIDKDYISKYVEDQKFVYRGPLLPPELRKLDYSFEDSLQTTKNR